MKLKINRGIDIMSLPIDCPVLPTTRLPFRIAYQLKRDEMTVNATDVRMLAARCGVWRME